MVAQACRMIETAEDVPSLEALAQQAGISPFHFHRVFCRITGVTPKAYADADRTRRVQAGLSRLQSVTHAIYDAGFNSPGRFYAAADGMLGMTPGRYRSGGAGEAIIFATGPCDLGVVLVAQAARGLCAILLGDDADQLQADLHARFPKAAISQSADLGAVLQAVIAHIAHPTQSLGLPLDIRGTAFQRRVWEVLQTIPPGQIRHYSDIAQSIGKPAAVRAVASAIALGSLGSLARAAANQSSNRAKGEMSGIGSDMALSRKLRMVASSAWHRWHPLPMIAIQCAGQTDFGGDLAGRVRGA